MSKLCLKKYRKAEVSLLHFGTEEKLSATLCMEDNAKRKKLAVCAKLKLELAFLYSGYYQQ